MSEIPIVPAPIRFFLQLKDDTTVVAKINAVEPSLFMDTYNKFLSIPEKKYNRSTGQWSIPINSFNMEYITSTFDTKEYFVEEATAMHLKLHELTEKQKTLREKRRFEYLFNNKFESRIPNAIQFGTKAFKHQLVGLESIHNAEYFALLMEMGTGKTKVIIDECAWVVQENPNKRFWVLIIAPKTICWNWQREFKKHMPEGIPYSWIRLRNEAKLIDDISLTIREPTKLKVFAINYDALRNPGNLEALKLIRPDLCVLDESTSIKNPSAEKTKSVFELAGFCKRRIILTGTPSPNNVMDLWSQYHYLKPGALGFTAHKAFKRHYAIIEGRYDQVVGVRNFEELKARIAKCSFIVKKDQCLDLPPKSYTVHAVEMGTKQRELYNKMRDEFIIALESGKITEATVIIVQLLRLSQICCGFLKTTEKDVIPIDDGDVKIRALEEIFEEIPQENKVLIWARFREDIKRISKFCEDNKISYRTIYGEVKEEDRIKAQDDFNIGPNPRVIIGEPGTGGLGLTLIGSALNPCTTVIYYSNDFSLLKRLQSEDRAHRMGQTKPVTYIDIICEDSVEEYIAEKLQGKKDFQDAVKDIKSLKKMLLGTD